MDEDLTRLCSIKGHHDLCPKEASEVLAISEETVRRLVQKGRLEAKLHSGRGNGSKTRIRISRGAIVRYLVRICSGDKGAILAAVEMQCPQFLAAAQGVVNTPSNVIPMHGPRQQRKHTPKADVWHPKQLALFEEFPSQATA